MNPSFNSNDLMIKGISKDEIPLAAKILTDSFISDPRFKWALENYTIRDKNQLLSTVYFPLFCEHFHKIGGAQGVYWNYTLVGIILVLRPDEQLEIPLSGFVKLIFRARLNIQAIKNLISLKHLIEGEYHRALSGRTWTVVYHAVASEFQSKRSEITVKMYQQIFNWSDFTERARVGTYVFDENLVNELSQIGFKKIPPCKIETLTLYILFRDPAPVSAASRSSQINLNTNNNNNNNNNFPSNNQNVNNVGNNVNVNNNNNNNVNNSVAVPPSNSRPQSIFADDFFDFNTPQQPQPQPQQQQQPQQPQSQNLPQQQQSQTSECAICMEKPTNCAFVPCGHESCCFDCATTLKQCPICRKGVDSVLRLFKS